MSAEKNPAEQLQTLAATPELVDALKGETFQRFLDLIPIAIVVSQTTDMERIIYVNPEAAALLQCDAAALVSQTWDAIAGVSLAVDQTDTLAEALVARSEFVGTFIIERAEGQAVTVDAYSNVIESDDDGHSYRLAAFVDSGALSPTQRAEFEQRLRDKDTLLFEIQHRVKNNLQMIAALIRIEARNVGGLIDTAPFDRLAGRIQAIQTLYALLATEGHEDVVDLGVYLSQIASSVLGLHSVEGVTLDLKVGSFPVSVNVAMPAGLVVNELLTNALKHAFDGRSGGTIVLHCSCDAGQCRIIVADDGVGLPDGVIWPKRGRLSAAIVQTLRDNAHAVLDVHSQPGQGTRVTITFPHE